MKIATFRWRCHRCAELMTPCIQQGEETADQTLIQAMAGMRNDPLMDRYKAHRCADGNTGVAELIGYDVD